MNIEKLQSAADLPASWNKIANSYFQTRSFLEHCEQWNPCDQRYYLAYEKDHLKVGAIVYTIELNLFTYARLKVMVTTHIAGVPCSVSSSGFIGDKDCISDLFNHICEQEPGLSLSLNLPVIKRDSEKYAVGNTLPVIISENTHRSWDEYRNSIRAPYRRRLRTIYNKSKNLNIDRFKCHEFSMEMHQLYLQVFKRSDAKLECLSYEFFKNLPDAFQLTTAKFEGKVVGWTITIKDSEVFYFFLGGVDYSENDEHNIYLRLLTDVYQQGIECGAKQIDLGQTAEVPKLRLGGKTKPLYMGVTHSNSILAVLLRWSMGILEYKKDIPFHYVFKES